MRLALKLGITLAEVKAKISSPELSAWMAFDKIDPFTIDRTELMLARLMAMIANITQKRSNFTANDFLLFIESSGLESDMGKLEKAFKATYGNNIQSKR